MVDVWGAHTNFRTHGGHHNGWSVPWQLPLGIILTHTSLCKKTNKKQFPSVLNVIIYYPLSNFPRPSPPFVINVRAISHRGVARGAYVTRKQDANSATVRRCSALNCYSPCKCPKQMFNTTARSNTTRWYSCFLFRCVSINLSLELNYTGKMEED